MSTWDDYRFFLAVAAAGSLSGAARALKVSQPTVGRRIGDLETRLGARLFDRVQHGLELTAAGTRIVDLAKRMEENALTIERRVAGEDQQLYGRVTVAAAEGIATYWLAPRLPRLAARHPAIELELVVGTGAINLLRREADIALRVGPPGDADIIGRRLGSVGCGLYGATSYLERHGTPAKLGQLCEHRIIESVREIAHLRQAQDLRELAEAATISLRCNNIHTQLAAARAGLGLLALPHYMAGFAPELKPVLDSQFQVQLDLWLLTHRDLRHTARVRAVLDFLAEEVRADPLFRDDRNRIRVA